MPRDLALAEHARLLLVAACEGVAAQTTRFEFPSSRDLTAQAHAERFRILTDLYRIGAGFEDLDGLSATDLRLRSLRPAPLRSLASLNEAEPLAGLMVAGLNALGAALEVDLPEESEGKVP